MELSSSGIHPRRNISATDGEDIQLNCRQNAPSWSREKQTEVRSMQENGEGIRDSDKEEYMRKTKKSRKYVHYLAFLYIFFNFYAKLHDGPLGPKHLAHCKQNIV